MNFDDIVASFGEEVNEKSALAFSGDLF